MPAAGVAWRAGLCAVLAGTGGALWVARLRATGVRVAYTRKIFHVVVFSAAALVHATWDLPGTVVFGVIVAGMVLAAVVRGDGDPFYEALARDKDRPHRALFVVMPLVTTAVGGLASAWITGPYAVVGYLAAGWGDAVGEPVGARFGRHPYRVPSLAGVTAERTLEGSAAVLVVSGIGSTLALVSLGVGPTALWAGPACGVAAAAVEAFSNHGLDNLTVQVVPSLLALFLLGPA